MRLLLIRHGETEENVNGIIMGHIHGVLTKKGIAQAEETAKRLSNEKFDVIYSSDLGRARKTAEAIAKFQDCPLILTEGLRERDYGKLEGKTKKEINLAEECSAMTIEVPGGENHEQLRERAKNFIIEIYGLHKNGNVAVVSHNGFIKTILNVIEGKGMEDLRSSLVLPHSKEIEVKVDEEKIRNIKSGSC